MGQTPWIAPNRFAPDATVEVRVVYPGAQEWVGSFKGGANATITAELQAQTEAPPAGAAPR
jgi:hypothetical protein